MLELENIKLSAGGNRLLELDSVVLNKGVVALVGRNGSGKSTFIRMLLGEHSDYSGSIKWMKKNLSDLSMAEKAKQISVVYARSEVFGNHRVKDLLMLGRLPYQSFLSSASEADHQKVDEILSLLKIKDWSEKYFQVLSDGEKQLVMIGRSLVQDTPIILMDEPAAFLDVVNRFQLSVLLKEIAVTTGKLIIYSTHQLDRIEKDCDELLLIQNGKMKQYNQPSEFIQNIHQAFEMI